jgi:hypothetical protein
MACLRDGVGSSQLLTTIRCCSHTSQRSAVRAPTIPATNRSQSSPTPHVSHGTCVACWQAKGAVAAGVMPWQLWFDPGLGFAKHGAQSLQLIRNLPRVRHQLRHPVLRHAPMLLGPSRKVCAFSLSRRLARGRWIVAISSYWIQGSWE